MGESKNGKSKAIRNAEHKLAVAISRSPKRFVMRVVGVTEKGLPISERVEAPPVRRVRRAMERLERRKLAGGVE
jgi:hypothetical protein